MSQPASRAGPQPMVLSAGFGVWLSPPRPLWRPSRSARPRKTEAGTQSSRDDHRGLRGPARTRRRAGTNTRCLRPDPCDDVSVSQNGTARCLVGNAVESEQELPMAGMSRTAPEDRGGSMSRDGRMDPATEAFLAHRSLLFTV